jgi:hypothetical protein
MPVRNPSKCIKRIRCKNGKLVYKIQGGKGILSSLFKIGAKAAKRLAKSVNWGALGRKAFNTTKKIAYTAGSDFANKHKQELIDKSTKAASDFVADKSQKIINDLVKSKSIAEAGQTLKNNINALPQDASKDLKKLVNDSKKGLISSGKKSISKGIKENTKSGDQKLVLDVANALSPSSANILNNIIKGEGIKKRRRKIKGSGIKILV